MHLTQFRKHALKEWPGLIVRCQQNWTWLQTFLS